MSAGKAQIVVGKPPMVFRTMGSSPRLIRTSLSLLGLGVVVRNRWGGGGGLGKHTWKTLRLHTLRLAFSLFRPQFVSVKWGHE